MNAMPGSERKELAGFAGLEGARLDLSALEAQKDKYAVLAQLQPLAVSLASGDPVAGQVRVNMFNPTPHTMNELQNWLDVAI